MKFKKYLKLLIIPICIFITSNLYAIDPLSKPPQVIGQYPGIFFGVRGMVGTSNTFVISVGDTPLTGSGSAGYMGTSSVGADQYAGIRYNGATNKWQFKGTDTATWDDMSNITSSYLDVNFVKQNAGTGSGQTFTNMTQDSGTQSGSINSTATYTMNGATISPTEISYLDNLSSNIQTQIDGKLTKVGTPTTYLNDIIVDGKQGTTSVKINNGSGLAWTSVLNPNGQLEVTGNITGSASAKPDLKDNGVIEVVNAEFLNIITPLTLAPNGLGGDLDLDETLIGTQTPGANTIVRSDENGKLNNWITQSSKWTFYGTNSVFTVPSSITTIFVTMKAAGGGGGGGGGTSNWRGGGGGSSGNAIIKQRISVTPLGTHSVSIGVGGAGGVGNHGGAGSDGSGGGATSFGTVTVSGGNGGGGGNTSTPGNGGASSGFLSESGQDSPYESGGLGGKGINQEYGLGGLGGTGDGGTATSGLSGTNGFCLVEY